ncbi:putative disease resistance protein RGA1 [Quercus robur]|uniref:putative disease resistance protein RGA1 n=1 Tax=Quercus robur TaxID=38942 RepID=UPI002163D881|nr:putative disease resistance protein RGA1 [Quercus robur]
MAEAMPFEIARKIIELLGSTTFEEIGSIWGVKDELQKLKNTVSTIQAVFQKAEELQYKKQEVRDWIMKLRGAIYDADDLLTDLSTQDLRRREMGDEEMAKKVRTFFSSSNQVAFRLKMAHKLKAMVERLKEIENDMKNLELVACPPQATVVSRERDQTHSFVEEIFLGRKEDKNNIIGLLLDVDEGHNVSFISIVGIGGLGKTTLAQHVYNDEQVKAFFELKMWVSVSEVFSVKTVAEKIIECATGRKPDNFPYEVLQNRVHQELDQKKFLLVLDDVWNVENEEWSNLKCLLMGGSKGSKVLITTRTRLIAKITSTVSPYFLKGLSVDKSWSLLKRIAFNKGEDSNPDHEDIGKKIVEKCQGVPLAIKMIGRVLYFKGTVDEWSDIKNKELTNVDHEENNILSILKLSYDYLPVHLKCCFTYCSMFPKDYEIRKLTLIQLWIAQGFIRSSVDNPLLEDVADGYCMDLHLRAFFQETKEDYSGNITSFKMHNLVHDLAQSISRTECTLFDSNAQNFNENVGHLSFPFYNVFEKNISLLVKAKKARTFILTSDPRYSDQEVEQESPFSRLISPTQKVEKESSLERLISSFRCLRVLDLHDLKIVTVTNSIDNLKYLKYLDLSENDIKFVPSCIIRLLHLETLKLSRCVNLIELPKDIQKMVSLKHLEIDGCKSLTHMPCGLGQLILQTLPLFVVSKDPTGSSSKPCGELAELNKLYDVRGGLHIKNLSWLKDATSETKAAILKDKKYLRDLKLSWDSDGNDSTNVHSSENLWEGLQPHPTLKKLQVIGYLGQTFPRWLPSLTSLIKLEIWQCVWKHLSPLYQLLSLRELYLKSMIGLECISNQKMTDEASLPTSWTNVFPALESLKLWDCPNLEGWWRTDIVEVNIDNDQGDVATKPSTSSQQHISLPFFPRLSYLYVRNCVKLTCMPLFPNLKEGLILSNANLKPLQQTMAMTMDMIIESSLPSSSSSSSSPPLSKLKSLSLFRMQDIESLSDDWLQNLTSLEYLEIWACPRLKSLSRFMQSLTSLKKLEIGDFEEVDLICDESDNSTKWDTNLQEIRLSIFPHLDSLPKCIGNLKSLQSLKIDEWPNLTSLPEWIGDLTSLQKIEIYLCPKLTSLPEGMRNLRSLQSLEIINCPKLKESCQEKIGEDWPKIAHIPIFRNL